VVDDEPTNIDILQAMLETEGFGVVSASGGEQALQIARRQPIDLVLLDVMMPGLSGYDTCRRLKADPVTREIPIIFVTAKSSAADVVEGFDAGAVDYVPKPFRHGEVCARVRTQLKLRSLLLEHSQIADRERRYARKLEQIFETIEDGILTLDADGTIRTANRGAESILGARAEDLIGAAFRNFVVGDHEVPEGAERDGAHPTPEDAPARGRREVLARRPDRTNFPMEVSVTRLEGPDDVFVAVLHDISSQKATEQHLRKLSRTDALTGLPNRRRFKEFLETEWRRALRNPRPVSLLMIDIDFFKNYNDTYGHQAGDHCLTEVARVIEACCQRAADLAARYGGEEFAVILPETDLGRATDLADRIREAVQVLAIPHAASRVSDVVTVSVGAASIDPDPMLTVSLLVAMADRALYQAKAQGRNRVVS
jgi:diguanylate cyclase (GGDEF)-like protein/PAS domain S-box-containing protein